MGFSVLDASAFYAGIPFASPETYHTTPSVYDEVRHIKSDHGAIDTLIDVGRLVLREASPESTRRVREQAKSAGEHGKLSEPDISVIALCAELGGVMVTDDFAVSNVSKLLQMRVIPVMTRGTRAPRRWVRYCASCSRNMHSEESCRVCGSAASRRPAR